MKNKADNKKRNFLTHSEIESLLKAANTGPHAARNYCLTLLCFIHGFRASEICRLRISDIDLKAKCIYIHRLKKGFSTTHPLLNKEVQALKNWLSIRTDQTVQLGQVRTASLAQEGATSSAVGFNIQLNDCDTTVADKAAIAFLGTAIDGTHPNVLALQSSAAGSATKVGVQILDRTGAALALDGATFSAQTTLNNGTNTIPFQARYYAIGAATPGAANADATFKVQYQ